MYSIIIWLINKDGQTCRWLIIDTSLEKWCRCCLLYRSAQLCMMLTSMYMAHQFNICHRWNLVLCVSLIEFIRSSLGYDSVAGRIYDIAHYIGSTLNRIGRELYVVPHLIVLFVRSEEVKDDDSLEPPVQIVVPISISLCLFDYTRPILSFDEYENLHSNR